MKTILYNRPMKYLLFSLSILIYLTSLFFIEIIPINMGYKYTYLLPLSFIICFFLFLWDVVIRYKSPYLIAFSVIAFLRYVILPYALLLEGDYNGYSYIPPDQAALQSASWMMVYEIIIVSFVINAFSKRMLNKLNKNYSLIVQKNNVTYSVSFFIFLLAILVIPQASEGISVFFNINWGINQEIGSNLVLFIRQCFIISKYFIYFAILSYVYNKKSLSKSKFIYILILFITLIIMSVQIGANRKNIISDAFALFFLIIKVFPKRKYSSIIILMTVTLIMFSAFTIFRGSIGQNDSLFSYIFSLKMLQPYLLGEYNVALAIEAKELLYNDFGIKNLLMDIFRPFFGIGAMLKNIPVLRSEELFAQRLSLGGFYRQDQIVPIIGQGFIYFGWILAPIFSVISAMVGIYCDTLYKKSNSIESCFFSAYFAINLAQAMILNFTILINIITFRIGIIWTLFYLNLLINRTFKNK